MDAKAGEVGQKGVVDGEEEEADVIGGVREGHLEQDLPDIKRSHTGYGRSVGTQEAVGEGRAEALGIRLGGVAQLALQLPFLYKCGMLLRPRWGWKHSGVRRILKLMVPTLFGSSVGQLTVLINTYLASWLVTGSISWLYYSDRLVELPVGLIGVALGTVILPRLSALRAADNDAQFVRTLDWALRWGFLVGSAAAVGLIVLAPSIIAGLLYGGRFDAHYVEMTTLSLRAYGIGALFHIMVKVLAPAFYARHDTKTPVKAGISAMLLNIVFALILSRYYAHVGLAAASSFAALANMSLLLYFLRREGVSLKTGSLWFFLRVLFANAALASILLYLQGDAVDWLAKTAFMRLRDLLLFVGLLVGCYCVVHFTNHTIDSETGNDCT